MTRLADEFFGPPSFSLLDTVFATQKRTATAIVYCEANFGAIDGKTANGLVRRSEKYEILSVIDSEKAGLDAGKKQVSMPGRYSTVNPMPFQFAAILQKLWIRPLRYRITSFLAWHRPVECFPCTSGAWCLRPSAAE
jgi:hypothetical protein